ncbi:hypothetical protein BJ508DRAFT_416946 [Ascobolus immersus RN42]|uniref:Uncharacterized protein n=1 Tax=Ascobolus immersus RN42 TaxID=1160509 RepID=A0A3N4HX61_ASCIM|nr:hypothetical protein BJ508DRAFT_416946 [Ascobolus immersus RN42]
MKLSFSTALALLSLAPLISARTLPYLGPFPSSNLPETDSDKSAIGPICMGLFSACYPELARHNTLFNRPKPKRSISSDEIEAEVKSAFVGPWKGICAQLGGCNGDTSAFNLIASSQFPNKGKRAESDEDEDEGVKRAMSFINMLLCKEGSPYCGKIWR